MVRDKDKENRLNYRACINKDNVLTGRNLEMGKLHFTLSLYRSEDLFVVYIL